MSVLSKGSEYALLIRQIQAIALYLVHSSRCIIII